jgi:hypothetical protein
VRFTLCSERKIKYLSFLLRQPLIPQPTRTLVKHKTYNPS